MPIEEEAVLLSEYQKLQQNSISKDEHDKVVKELKDKNQLYLKAITEGGKVNLEDEDYDLPKAINELQHFKGTNLEYWNKTTKAIDSLLKTVPEQEIVKITGTSGLDEILRVNQGGKALVEESSGDPDAFRAVYNKRVQESAPQIASYINKEGSVANFLQNQKNYIKK